MVLRDNQIEPVWKGIDFFKQKKSVPSIIVAPCAFGKSLVISKIAHEVGEKMIVLQPSAELLEQNLGKLRLLGGDAAVFSASLGRKEMGDLVYATIGSIKSLGASFRGYKLSIDECDRYPRDMDSMLGKFLKDSQISHILGFTATPLKLQTNSFNFQSYSTLKILTSRSKKGNLFKEIIHVCQIQEMLEKNYWSPLVYESHLFNKDLLVFNSTKAEYTEESIQRAYIFNNVEEAILDRVDRALDRKSILIFVPSVAEAQALAKKIPGAEAVWGDMDKKERKRIIDGFKDLSIRVVINVNVLSIGFDHPQLDCIIGGRSTASLSWFYQAMARGTRIHPLKQDCLIVDFVGNIDRFGRLESLYYKKEKIWKLYGEGGKLLTGIPIDQIGTKTEETEQKDATDPEVTFGKHGGKRVSQIPNDYLQWMLKNITWTKYNKHIYNAIKKKLCA